MLEKYQGNYVTAESADKYIDINAIISGCNHLANAGNNFTNISKKVYSAGDECNAEALSIDGETMTNYIYEQGKIIDDISPSISELAGEIINRSYEAYNYIQRQLNEQAYKKECKYANKLNKRL